MDTDDAPLTVDRNYLRLCRLVGELEGVLDALEEKQAFHAMLQMLPGKVGLRYRELRQELDAHFHQSAGPGPPA